MKKVLFRQQKKVNSVHKYTPAWSILFLSIDEAGCFFLQYNKVEISGIVTSKLKVLKEEEKIRLIKEARNGSKEAREKLVNGNLKLVLSVVQRFAGRGEDPDDLFQIGCIGLIKAIDNFDTNQNVRFSTYAVPMIIGEIRRFLRDNNPIRVSRSLRDIAYKTIAEKEKFMNKYQREPTAEELARLCGCEKGDIVQALEAIVEPLSLYEPIFSDGGDTIYVLDQVGDNNNDTNWLDEISIKESIKNLSDREKQIMSLRFFAGKTQVEVADEIGISQAQVSRLEKGALKKIKKNL